MLFLEKLNETRATYLEHIFKEKPKTSSERRKSEQYMSMNLWKKNLLMSELLTEKAYSKFLWWNTCFNVQHLIWMSPVCSRGAITEKQLKTALNGN